MAYSPSASRAGLRVPGRHAAHGARREKGVRVLGCLQYIHYSILNLAGTKDTRVVSDTRLELRMDEHY
jgi:hypothetical protein